jgi:hypothetical protein
VPLQTFPEFASMVRPLATEARHQGSLSGTSALEVIWELYRKRSCALLVTRDGALRKDAYVREGVLVFLSSNLPDERLGGFLVARNRIEQAELEVALDSMHTDNNRLGQTLVRLGLLSAGELEAELREQQIMRLVELCCWRHGTYEVIDGQGFAGGEVELGRKIPELLLVVARNLPENVLIADLIGRLHLVPVVVSLEAREAFPFNELERRVVDRLDGVMTGAEILAPFARDDVARRAALYTLDLLVLTGLVELRPRA